jgi:hypothetical protein
MILHRMIPLALLLASSIASAQQVAPRDDAEAKRFEAAKTAAAQAGYAEPGVLWHGTDANEAYFIVDGAHGDKRLLALVVAPRGKPAAVVYLGPLERLNQLQVEVQPLFTRPAIVDFVLERNPFQLETSTRHFTHDLVALDGASRLVCHIDGSSSSSTFKGAMDWNHHRDVRLTPERDAKPPALVVSTTEEMVVTPHEGHGEPRRTPQPPMTKRYQLPPGELCKEAPAP